MEKGYTFHIITFGCQMNERDSEWVRGMFLKEGLSYANSPEEADLILINACSVRVHAEERAFSYLGRFKKLKERKEVKLGLIGCTAEIWGEKLLDRFPYLDLIASPSKQAEMAKKIGEFLSSDQKLILLGTQSDPRGFCPEADYREKQISAFVPIMEGCDNFCSYCVVPYARGRERSRPLKEVVEELKFLRDKGYKEVMLLGQNVNSYRVDGLKPPYGFIKLLEEADRVGIERIRFMTSHPKDANEDLFKAMRDLRSVCEHLHLPLQAGSDRILSLMNRGYTLSHYMGLVGKLRKILPNCSLTTDIIVGFPTETEEDFDKTLYALREIRFDSAFIFKYSPRPLTQASRRLMDDVPKVEKERRNILALSLQKEISLRKKRDILGKEVEVLFEEQNEDGLYLGKSRQNFTVLVEGRDLIGKIKRVKVEEAKINILKGKLI